MFVGWKSDNVNIIINQKCYELFWNIGGLFQKGLQEMLDPLILLTLENDSND